MRNASGHVLYWTDERSLALLPKDLREWCLCPILIQTTERSEPALCVLGVPLARDRLRHHQCRRACANR